MAGYEKLLGLVTEHLAADEEIIASVFGAYEAKVMGNDSVRNGVLIATPSRVVFYAKKLGGHDLETFPLSNISSIESGKNMMGNTITFFASGNRVSLKWVNKGDIRGFVDFVQKNIGRPAASSAASAPTASIPDQIRQLAELRDQGILSDAEFDQKKSELLSKM